MNDNMIGKEGWAPLFSYIGNLVPRLLKTVYEVVLARELDRRELQVERPVPVPIV